MNKILLNNIIPQIHVNNVLKKVFLTGATGFVGSNILQYLINNGFEVYALVRDEKKIHINHKNLILLKGDILYLESYSNILKSLDAVIHLVGIIREYKNKGITFENLHINATKNIIEASKEARIKRFIHMSANGADKFCDITNYYKTKLRGEEIVKDSGLNYTIFRPSLIYGKGDGFIAKLSNLIKTNPIFIYFGKGNYKLQLVHVNNIAEIFVNSINNSNTNYKTFSICGNKTYLYKEIIQLIIKTSHRRRFLFSVPEEIVLFFTKMLERFEFYPLTVEQFKMLKLENICQDNRIFDILNIKQKTLNEEITNII